MAVVERYSPNIEWGKQHVEITLKQWESSAIYTVEVGGNCTGFAVLETAIGILYDLLSDAAPAGYPPTATLTHPDGHKLLCQDDEGRGEDWLAPMVVSAVITGWTAPTLNEVRRRNGAAPVADGDQPWVAP